MKKHCVLSLSGGADSSSLLLRLFTLDLMSFKDNGK